MRGDGKATLMDVAEAVEDAWGCDVADQAYRTGRSGGGDALVPGPARGCTEGVEEYGVRAASAYATTRVASGGGSGADGYDGKRLLTSLGIRDGSKLLMTAGGPRGGSGASGGGPSGTGGCGTMEFSPTQTVMEEPAVEGGEGGTLGAALSAAGAAGLAAAAARRVAGGGAPDASPPSSPAPGKDEEPPQPPAAVTFLGSSQRLGGDVRSGSGVGVGDVGGDRDGAKGGEDAEPRASNGGDGGRVDNSLVARRAAIAEAAERRAAAAASRGT